MKRILANDGISEAGVQLLESAGYKVLNVNVAQNQLNSFINNEDISILIVRSATRVDSALIDSCLNLKVIARIGSGMDNIDVEYAKTKGLKIINTPGSGAQSVAELVFAHLLGGTRFLHESNRNMPLEGDQHFKVLKKAYSAGQEIQGKTLGLIGMGHIGKAVARMALALGMEVCYHDPYLDQVSIPFTFQGGTYNFEITFENSPLNELLAKSDYVSLHLPAQKKHIIGAPELKIMKYGSAIINTSRGGLVDEVALLEALDSGHIRFAALDVFESEPNPEIQLLMRPELSLSPHIGGSTPEAQERASAEIANRIISLYSSSI
ncbi:MAG: hypothetical protein RLZZ241_332 [Bacteroidota bacterium]|jgi:D-3-phosphoglycerate dehydrogenase